MQNQKPAEAVALFDLDGTLADFDKSMHEHLDKMRDPNEPPVADEHDNQPSWITARRRLVKQIPGFWANLPRLELGFQVLQVATDLKFNNYILSKGPKKNPTAWAEKIIWVRRELGDDIPVNLSEDKGLVYGKVLVDDWPEYVTRWLEWRVRGLVVMVAQQWNEGFTHANVIRYDGKNHDELVERMQTIRATAG